MADDIEELAQILGSDDLDWSSDAFTFLEYDNEQQLIHTKDERRQEEYHGPSGNKRRMAEAFELNQSHHVYPSQVNGPVLVPLPAPKSESEPPAEPAPAPTVPKTSTRSKARAMLASSVAAEDGRTEAMAQRMERKKTREKMRRQEVNDQFNDLMEALAEVEENPKLQASRQNMDKSNFRVDVLSRAVLTIKRLSKEVKTEHAEVDKLRQQLEETRVTGIRPLGTTDTPPLKSAMQTVFQAVPVPGAKPGMGPLWVTMPMWMPNHGQNPNGISSGPPPPQHPAMAMPYFMQQHASAKGPPINGHPMPMSFPGMLPPYDGVATIASAQAESEDLDAPTHAPCA